MIIQIQEADTGIEIDSEVNGSSRFRREDTGIVKN